MSRNHAVAAALALAALLLFDGRTGAQNRPCGDEARKYCPEVTPGKGAIFSCLKPHMSELSEGCRKQVERVEERQKAMSDRRQKARIRRGGMHTPLASGATPVAAAPEPTK